MISVIVIAYNEEKYLPVILTSLQEQTYKAFEVIIVDSNSTDQTYQIATDYSSAFDQFKIIKLDTSINPAYSRNKGAEHASYNRMIFFDADTRFKPDFIERIMMELDKTKADIATCPLRVSEQHFKSNIGVFFLNMFMILLRPFYSTGYGACFISTKSVHQAVSGFNEDLGICEDCHYIKTARRKHNYKFRILSPYFYTSDRRASTEGEIIVLMKYFKIHLLRMLTGKEILKGEIIYNYGEY